MPTKLYLTNIDSEISGYKLATIGFPGPTASATSVGVAVTGTTAAGTDIALTATSGGTAIKWITPPLKSDATIAGSVVFNFWGYESNAAANTSLGVKLAEYTTSEQSAFCQTSYGTELGTTTSQIQRSRQPAAVGVVDGGTYTSTTIDAGNRIVILPIVTNIGTMRSGDAVTFDYNGSTNGSDGDAYVSLTETVRAADSQVGDGTAPLIPNGPSAMAYGDFVRQLDPVIQELTNGDNPEWLAVKDALNYQGNVGDSDRIQSA